MFKHSLKQDVFYVCDLIDAALDKNGRKIIGIAGPPGSGKSTLAAAVVKTLNASCDGPIPYAALLPMDGYHLDNQILKEMGLYERKGAPETFNSQGFCDAVLELQNCDIETHHPSFDREKDISISRAIAIHPQTDIIVIEGNYLLLPNKPWSSLQAAFSATVFVNPSLEILQERLVKRWTDQGLNIKTAKEKVAMNDIPNANLVITQSVSADLVLLQKPQSS